MRALVSLKSTTTIISHTMVRYRTSWYLEWKVFCFFAGGTFLLAVQIRRYLLRWYFTSRKRYIDSFYRSSPFTMHPIPFFRYRFLAIHSSLVPTGPQKRERRAQGTERSMFCFLFFWRINFSFSFLCSTTTFLEIRVVPSRRKEKKNSLQTVQAQVEGNAHV